MRFVWKDDVTGIDEQLEAVLAEMRTVGPHSEEYPKLLTHMERLVALKQKKHRAPISMDTLAAVAGNFALGAFVAIYENKHAMTSKVWGMMIRPRT